jgi:hypothetical protein
VAKGGKHLVLVNYNPDWIYDEWVYNGYDLQGAQVVFAHSRSAEENRELIRDFPGRNVWNLTLSPGQPELVREETH